MAQDSHSSNNKDLVPSKRIRRDDDGDDKNSCDSFLPGLDYDVSLTCLAQASRSDHASLFSLNRSFNALIKSGYLYDLRRQLQIAEYWVYMTCDPRVWEVFDLSRKKWMRLPKMPCDPCFNMADKESLTVSTELLVFGREFADFAIYKYSVVNREWARCEEMNRPRCLFASGSLGTIAVIAGGSDRVGNALRSAELYDIKTGKWEMLPNLSSPRKLCAGFFMDGKFYVIGGMASQTESLSCGEEYDFNTKTWRKIEGMCPTVNRPAEAPPLVAVVDNQLYAVEHTTNLVKKYNKDNNSWAVLGRLPVRADSNRGWGLGFKACGKEILVVGGQKGKEGEAIVLNSWCPSSGVHDGAIDWKVVCLKEHVGVFVYNCAVMGC